MADWLKDIAGITAQVATIGFEEKAQKNLQIQNSLLAQKKIDAEQYINNKLADPAYIADPTKIQTDFANELDTTGLSQESINNLNKYVSSSVLSLQKRNTTQMINTAKATVADTAVDQLSTIRNRVTAGQMKANDAINLYQKNIAPNLQSTLGSKFATYDKSVKSSFLLEELKNQPLQDAEKAVSSEKFISGMTSSDYALARHYVKSQQAETASAIHKARSLQVQVAKGVMDGTYTPAEIKDIQSQQTGLVSEMVGATAASMNTVKNMNVSQLENLLSTEQNLAPDMRGLLESRLHVMKSSISTDVVGWAEKNQEITPLNFSNTTSLKTSMINRVNDIEHLQQKYGVAAHTLFSPLEKQHIAFNFSQSTNQEKAIELSTIATAVTPTRYNDIDSTLYKGAVADMHMIHANPSSIGTLQDSLRGSDMIRNTPSIALNKQNIANIATEVNKVYENQPNLAKSMVDQIHNIFIARGLTKAGDVVKSGDVKDIIEEISGGSIVKGVSNSSPVKQTFIAKDKATEKLITNQDWTEDVFKTVAQSAPNEFVDAKDLMKTPAGRAYTVDDINKFGQFITIRPNVFKCVISDPNGNQVVLKNKDGEPIIFNTNLLTTKQKSDILLGKAARVASETFSNIF